MLQKYDTLCRYLFGLCFGPGLYFDALVQDRVQKGTEHKVQPISADMTLIAGTVPSLMEIVRGSLKCVLG